MDPTLHYGDSEITEAYEINGNWHASDAEIAGW